MSLSGIFEACLSSRVVAEDDTTLDVGSTEEDDACAVPYGLMKL